MTFRGLLSVPVRRRKCLRMPFLRQYRETEENGRRKSKERYGENSCTKRQIRRQTRLRYSRLHPRDTFYTPARSSSPILYAVASLSLSSRRTLDCKYVPPKLTRRWTRKIIQSPRFRPGTSFVLAPRAGSGFIPDHGFKCQRVIFLSFFFFFKIYFIFFLIFL